MAPKKESEDWKDVAMRFAVGTMRELGNTLTNSLHEKIDRMFRAFIRRMFFVFLLIIGSTFILLGFVYSINTLLASDFLGYILVGGLSLIIAGILHIARE